MNYEKTEKLFEEYPDLLKRELLTHDFDCQDGWFVLLDELASRIRQYCNYCSKSKKLEIVQIKQKMGALRIYFRGGDKVIRKFIQEAEDQSKTICELDGEPASGLYGCAPRWHRYLCEKCAELHDFMIIEDFHRNNAGVVSVHKRT